MQRLPTYVKIRYEPSTRCWRAEVIWFGVTVSTVHYATNREAVLDRHAQLAAHCPF